MTLSVWLGLLGMGVLTSCSGSTSMGGKNTRAPISKSSTAGDEAEQDADKTTPTDGNTKPATDDATADTPATPTPPAPVAFTLTSTAFQNNQMMPALYVAKGGGGNQSPPLQWKGAPAGAGSFAIQMVDLDFLSPAPSPFIHWVITGIPATSTQLPAAIPTGATLTTPPEAMGASQPRGVYRGPNPPNLHRYEFTIYAIKPGMTLTIGADSVVNRTELESKSLGKATIIGTYQ